jgi:hypothetical protein
MAVQTPDAPPAPDSTIEAGVIEDARRRQRRHRIAWMLPGAAAVAAGLFLALSGGGGGSDSRPITANAEVLRQVEQATAAKPGTIIVQVTRGSSSPSNDTSGVPSTVTEFVVETPAGRGPQNYLYASGDAPVVADTSDAYGVVNGVAQFYERKPNTVYKRVGRPALRTPNTIYSSNLWGPYITNGHKPGTFVYRRPKETALGTSAPQMDVDGSLPAKPLTLTATQAHALLDGSDTIVNDLEASNMESEARDLFDPSVRFVAGKAGGSRIAPVLRFPAVNLWLLLKAHDLKVVGLTNVDGRRAIELAGPKAGTKLKDNPQHVYHGDAAGVRIWVDATTYAPIKEVIDQAQGTADRTPATRSTETWLEYRTLPINAANQRLLSPLALYPHAHIDRNYNDYVNATYESFNPRTELP